MNEITQISRMIRTLQLLSTRKSLTTTDLLDYFDHSISRRTLQRDMLALSDSGVPLVNEKITANDQCIIPFCALLCACLRQHYTRGDSRC